MEDELETMLSIGFDDESLAPFRTCSIETAEASLKLASIDKNDIFYDLGCGDGRLCIIASRLFGCKSVGIENFYFHKCQSSYERAEDVHHLVSFREEDALTCNLDDCTVCITYLLPEGLAQIKERVKEILLRGGRYVSISWEMVGWKPMKVEIAPTNARSCYLYLYTKESLPN